MGIAEIWRVLDLKKIITAVCYLRFEKPTISSVDCVQSRLTRHPAKFLLQQLKYCEKMSFFKVL